MYGPLLTELPTGFVPYYQWPEYDLAANPLASFSPELVGKKPRGIRWGWWPLFFEDYISDDEPNMALSDPHGTARFRTVTWHRVTRTDRPKGWYQLAWRPARLEGFADLGKSPDYTHGWDESARRYRRKWLADCLNQTHRVEKISFSEFATAYHLSLVVKVVKNFQIDALERKLQSPLAPITLWGVRNTTTGDIVAGMAVLDSPTCQGSYYICGFFRDIDKKTPSMVGLMDHWYRASQESGLRFLHMGEFWMPGKPKNWKGFSIFKAKFGIYYISQPPTLIRFVLGKLF